MGGVPQAHPRFRVGIRAAEAKKKWVISPSPGGGQQKAPLAPLDTALSPPRSLLLDQAPGDEATSFFCRAKTKKFQKKSSTAFCQIWPKMAFEKSHFGERLRVQFAKFDHWGGPLLFERGSHKHPPVAQKSMPRQASQWVCDTRKSSHGPWEATDLGGGGGKHVATDCHVGSAE